MPPASPGLSRHRRRPLALGPCTLWGHIQLSSGISQDYQPAARPGQEQAFWRGSWRTPRPTLRPAAGALCWCVRAAADGRGSLIPRDRPGLRASWFAGAAHVLGFETPLRSPAAGRAAGFQTLQEESFSGLGQLPEVLPPGPLSRPSARRPDPRGQQTRPRGTSMGPEESWAGGPGGAWRPWPAEQEGLGGPGAPRHSPATAGPEAGTASRTGGRNLRDTSRCALWRVLFYGSAGGWTTMFRNS